MKHIIETENKSAVKVNRNSNLLLVKKEQEEQIEGVFLPNRNPCVFRTAIIVDKGDGKSDDEKKAMKTLSIGDKILVEKLHGQEIIVNGEKLYFIDISAVQGILRK